MTAIPMLLFCPCCDKQHIDEAEREAHKSHECQSCGYIWRPADVETAGVWKLESAGENDMPASPWKAKTTSRFKLVGAQQKERSMP